MSEPWAVKQSLVMKQHSPAQLYRWHSRRHWQRKC
jgi:hypothetical protein